MGVAGQGKPVNQPMPYSEAKPVPNPKLRQA